jgi:hypothetical protein
LEATAKRGNTAMIEIKNRFKNKPLFNGLTILDETKCHVRNAIQPRPLLYPEP